MIGIWKKLNLTQKFGLAAGGVMTAGTLVIGTWVSNEIKTGVTLNAATNAALFMETYVAPLAGELADKDYISIGPVLALDEAFSTPAVDERILAVRIWKPDGTVVYANDLEVMGEKFDPSQGLLEAAEGKVFSEYFARGEITEVDGTTVDVPVMEIYSPIRLPWSDEIVAVLEFYEDATSVAATLAAARNRSWLMVGASMLVMTMALLGIVHSGSILIERQRRDLQRGAKRNAELARRVERASGRSAELAEQHLRRVSADLHDGPAQLISLAALRIGGLPLARNDQKTKREVADISGALGEAMREIRDICHGLSLPEIENQSLEEITADVTNSHAARTATRVDLDVEDIGVQLQPHEKICIYRFFQEGLNNAFRHGKGKGQRVEIRRLDEKRVRFVVFNDYENGEISGDFKAGTKQEDAKKSGMEYGGIGLLGLGERVQALGGEFSFDCSVGEGARLQMILNIGSETDNGKKD